MAGSSHLKPGEKGVIVVKMDITGRRGSIAETVEVDSNSPDRSVITLTIKAFIPDFELPGFQ